MYIYFPSDFVPDIFQIVFFLTDFFASALLYGDWMRKGKFIYLETSCGTAAL